jgi:hypothetical protein
MPHIGLTQGSACTMAHGVSAAPPHLLRSMTMRWQTVFETPLQMCCSKGVYNGTLYFKSTQNLTELTTNAGWSSVIRCEGNREALLERSRGDAPTTEAHPTDHRGD